MLNVLLLNYCRSRRWRAVGVVLALLLIWGYTFLSGLPPSLVRATVMYSLMLAGSLLGRAGFSINSLALAAMLMLCVDPLLSYDVGFQLSFLAMAGILALCPRFLDLPLARRPWVGWVVQSLLVSFAAQLFTIPLVAYRFGTFAPYSALATLLVSPVTALLIYGMPVLLFSALLGLGSEAVSAAIGFLEACQNGCLRLMMKWPGAVVHTDWGLCFTSLCYVALGVWIIQPFRYKAMRWKMVMAGAIGLFAAFHVCRWAGRVRPEVVFYNQPSCPAVHVIYSPSSSYLFTVARDSVRERMAYVAESFWQKETHGRPVNGGRRLLRRCRCRASRVGSRQGRRFFPLAGRQPLGRDGRKRTGRRGLSVRLPGIHRRFAVVVPAVPPAPRGARRFVVGLRPAAPCRGVSGAGLAGL